MGKIVLESTNSGAYRGSFGRGEEITVNLGRSSADKTVNIEYNRGGYSEKAMGATFRSSQIMVEVTEGGSLLNRQGYQDREPMFLQELGVRGIELEPPEDKEEVERVLDRLVAKTYAQLLPPIECGARTIDTDYGPLEVRGRANNRVRNADGTVQTGALSVVFYVDGEEADEYCLAKAHLPDRTTVGAAAFEREAVGIEGAIEGLDPERAISTDREGIIEKLKEQLEEIFRR